MRVFGEYKELINKPITRELQIARPLAESWLAYDVCRGVYQLFYKSTFVGFLKVIKMVECESLKLISGLKCALYAIGLVITSNRNLKNILVFSLFLNSLILHRP